MAHDNLPDKVSKNPDQQGGAEQRDDQVDEEHASLQSPQAMAAEMARAFQEIARGEQTASALERQLDGIESRIDQLLASVEHDSRQREGDRADESNRENDKSSS